ncbi:MAG: SpoIIE family protein phosphatase [Chloroflexia bacterium]|nr:SpoIIE family protein phosphatase [Chloroflexia bacterium]
MNYAVVSRPKHKGDVSGDAYLVRPGEDLVLLALVDGLGSGEEAAKASQAAIVCIDENYTAPLKELLRLCHRALRNTRGAVLGLLRVEFDAPSMRFVGVGNIGFVALSEKPFHPISYNGIVGYRLPRVHEFVGDYTPGDTFILHSDGVDGRFRSDSHIFRHQNDLQDLAELLANRYGKENDDICVLVAR